MKPIFLILFAGCFFQITQQNFQLISSVAIDERTEVSQDRAGHIYIATYKGDIIRYDTDLQNKLVFSPPNPNRATALEAWQGLRIFSFHRDLQQFRLINRNLSLHEDYSFPQDIIGFAEMATPSFDNNIWLIDQADFSLIKYDITSRLLISRTPLEQLLDPDNYEILFLKEYQNRLFLSTKHRGILIFDNLGTYLKKFEYKNISSFNFEMDNMYFIEGNNLVEINLYSDHDVKRALPKNAPWLFAIIRDGRTYLFSKNQISCYR